MRLTLVFRFTGIALLLCAVAMLVSALWGIAPLDSGVVPLLLSAAIILPLGLYPLLFVPTPQTITSKEGLVIVALSWLGVSLVGTLPYLMYGAPFTLATAWFESVSGFTTTGATILDDVESLPRSLLFWRSLTHWLGGIGIVAFMLILVPQIGAAQMVLSRTEFSSLARKDYQWRSSRLLRVIITTYVGLTLLLTLLLWPVGIPLFDSLNIAFSTIATGGFAIKNQSLAAYQNSLAEGIVGFFMFISSVHLGLMYPLFRLRKPKSLLHAPVVRFFTLIVLASALLIAITIQPLYDSFLRALHYALFTVISFFSTTGFCIVETQPWSSTAVLILFLALFMGGCAGSTSGGIKQDRIQIMLASFRAHIRQQVHPQAVIPPQIGQLKIEQNTLTAIMQFILIYLTLVLCMALVTTLHGIGFTTSLSLSASCMSNAGPILGDVSSFNSLAFLPVSLKVLLPLFMLIGRLEIFGLLLLFAKETWQ